MVSLLSWASLLHEALNFNNGMPFKPVLWSGEAYLVFVESMAAWS